MPARDISSLAKLLDDSMRAAAAVGPAAAMPSAFSLSTRPRASGFSGHTTTRSAPTSRAAATCPSTSVAATGRQRATSSMPALPGAAYSAPTPSLCASFHTMACSRPPPPTTSTVFLRDKSEALLQQSVPEMPPAGENHGDAVAVGRLDGGVVPNRAAGLHDHRHARRARGLHHVREREKRIRRHDRAPGAVGDAFHFAG